MGVFQANDNLQSSQLLPLAFTFSILTLHYPLRGPSEVHASCSPAVFRSLVPFGAKFIISVFIPLGLRHQLHRLSLRPPLFPPLFTILFLETSSSPYLEGSCLFISSSGHGTISCQSLHPVCRRGETRKGLFGKMTEGREGAEPRWPKMEHFKVKCLSKDVCRGPGPN